MRKLSTYIGLSLGLVAIIAFGASTFTTNYNLEKPADGDSGWGSSYRSNLDTIDTQLFTSASGLSSHLSDTTDAHDASAISATDGTFCDSVDDVQEYLDCIDGQLTAIIGGEVVLTTGDQTIGGVKTFTSPIVGDLTGDVTGDLTGDVTGDVTGNVTGDLTGNVTGNVTGDLTGNVTGDLTGNVTGDISGAITATGVTSGHVVIGSTGGLLSSESTLDPSRGGFGTSVAASTGYTYFTSGTVSFKSAATVASEVNSSLDHGNLTGLSDDDHTQYSLLAGRSGGQTLTGGTDASNNLVLRSTSNGTKGQVYVDETTTSTSSTTGALRVGGGVGIAENINVAGTATVNGALKSATSVVMEDPGGGTNTVTLSAPTLAANRTITFPSDDPAANQILYSTDTSGTMAWKDESANKTWSAEATNYTITATVGSSALTIALKNSAGSDPSAGSPACFGFRSATASTGTYTQTCATAATSLVISSGSTLGQTSAVASDIHVFAIDSGSGLVLGAMTIPNFDESAVVSSTSEGGAGAADSATTLYTTSGVSSKPARLIAILTNTQATAGTWASTPSTIKLRPFKSFAGGTALCGDLSGCKIASFDVDAAAAITLDTDGATSGGSVTGTSVYTVNFNAGFWKSAPNCMVTPTQDSAGASTVAITSRTTSAISYTTRNGTGTLATRTVSVLCRGR